MLRVFRVQGLAVCLCAMHVFVLAVCLFTLLVFFRCSIQGVVGSSTSFSFAGFHNPIRLRRA